MAMIEARRWRIRSLKIQRMMGTSILPPCGGAPLRRISPNTFTALQNRVGHTHEAGPLPAATSPSCRTRSLQCVSTCRGRVVCLVNPRRTGGGVDDCSAGRGCGNRQRPFRGREENGPYPLDELNGPTGHHPSLTITNITLVFDSWKQFG